jgi:hypothetical protein
MKPASLSHVKMLLRMIVPILLTTTLLCCWREDAEKHKREEAIRKQLLGEWKLCEKNHFFEDDVFITPGMRFFHDSMDVYTGFFGERTDSVSGRVLPVFMSNYCSYELNEDSIFIKSPSIGKREFILRFHKRSSDTLFLKAKNNELVKYKSLSYKIDTLPDFDQIIYSSSGCYGTCPIMNISVDKRGRLLYHGEGYVTPLGYYTGQLSSEKTAYMFTKFRKANPLRLSDHYSVRHTDDQTITTTFIKNGKIVKSINDYGMDGPAELCWAYISIGNIYTQTKLDLLPENKPFYEKLHYLRFKKGKWLLRLEKSESFYLWTELKKSKQTQNKVKAIYTL